MKHYDKFQNIHELLKEYGCKATFKWEKEYQDGGEIVFEENIVFYASLEEIKTDKMNREWEEEINAALDVVVNTKMQGADVGTIRFDISYSEKVKKYSMYISLPTHMRSVSLSKGNYKKQEEVISEIQKWLIVAKCKKPKKEKNMKKESSWECEQISLF